MNNDLISRSKAIEALLKQKMPTPSVIRRVLMQVPGVDAVEVVRCKDCKHHHWEQEPCHGKTVHLCDLLKTEVWRDFYCYYGERREENAAD